MIGDCHVLMIKYRGESFDEECNGESHAIHNLGLMLEFILQEDYRQVKGKNIVCYKERIVCTYIISKSCLGEPNVEKGWWKVYENGGLPSFDSKQRTIMGTGSVGPLACQEYKL